MTRLTFSSAHAPWAAVVADRSAKVLEPVSRNEVEATCWVHELDNPFVSGSHRTRYLTRDGRFPFETGTVSLRDWDGHNKLSAQAETASGSAGVFPLKTKSDAHSKKSPM